MSYGSVIQKADLKQMLIMNDRRDWPILCRSFGLKATNNAKSNPNYQPIKLKCELRAEVLRRQNWV
ncbi:hypothetical protein VTH8203_00822 [Vibrio thalassae]|uniref:Uncharacterized protein n=1 Tax=Vibrio thalassae TaxID=1243014 RepID=A0A240EFC3_9VIBR|nr:hypothetical protein VTH8203_00822 [Vibrio thalassae]